MNNGSGPAVSSYRVGIRTCSDYSPFGLELDGRTVSNYGYRFGYQGSEKDDEFKGNGNSYTTDFRQLDPRLGRWLSVDPLSFKFPWQSTYIAFDNNPILLVDRLGSETEGGPDDPKKVAIDAGHGIKGVNNPKVDPGAVNSDGVMEKDLALNISKSINSNLQSFKVSTTMIREGDLTVSGNSLTFRTDKAKSDGADIFVSIHINSASSETASGFTVLFKNDGSNAAENKALAESISNSQQTMTLKSSPTTVRNDLSVLNRFSGTGPAVLVEVGFITNDRDVKLMSSNYEDIGREIAVGIYTYIYGKAPNLTPKISQETKKGLYIPENLPNGLIKDNTNVVLPVIIPPF
jgi:RHS repeat-associated protein